MQIEKRKGRHKKKRKKAVERTRNANRGKVPSPKVQDARKTEENGKLLINEKGKSVQKSEKFEQK